jgi:hypothetical protein
MSVTRESEELEVSVRTAINRASEDQGPATFVDGGPVRGVQKDLPLGPVHVQMSA